MKPYTDQTALNAVVAHSRKQPEKSQSPFGAGCQYRGPHGLMCFVGALIPEPEMQQMLSRNESLNTRCVTEVVREPEIEDLFSQVNPALLSRIQKVHDTKRVQDWDAALRRVARDCELAFPEVAQPEPSKDLQHI